MAIKGPVTEPPPELPAVLSYMQLRPLRLLDGTPIPDLGLDKKAVKAAFAGRVAAELMRATGIGP